MQIKDPDGDAGRIKDGLLHTRSVGFSEQRYQSEVQGNAYQTFGTTADVGGGTHPILLLVNDDTTGLVLVVTYIRVLAVNIATTGAFGAGTYFTVGFDQTRNANGTVVTPVNKNRSSGKAAQVTAYSGGDLAGAGTELTLSGTEVVSDRHYPEANLKEHVWRKEGSIILTQGKSICLKLVTDFTTGYAYGRISFVMAKKFPTITPVS